MPRTRTLKFNARWALPVLLWIVSHIQIQPSFAGKPESPPVKATSQTAKNQVIVKIPAGTNLSPKLLKMLHSATQSATGIPNHKQSSVPYWRGHSLLDVEKYQAAIPFFTQYIEAYKRESLLIKHEDKVVHDFYLAWGYQNRGYCYLKLKRYDDGIRDLTEAIKLRPRYPPNYSNRAIAYRITGNSKLAEQDLLKVHSLPAITGDMSRDLQNEFGAVSAKPHVGS